MKDKMIQQKLMQDFSLTWARTQQAAEPCCQCLQGTSNRLHQLRNSQIGAYKAITQHSSSTGVILGTMTVLTVPP
jgi:hypothetical protein